MPIPCNHCGIGAPFDGEYDVSRQCRLCFLYARDPAQRKIWDSDPVQMPSPLGVAVNFGKAMIRNALNGGKTASAETQAARLALCNICPHLTAERRCAHRACGCWIDAKIKLASESCPIKKWESEL